MYVRNTCDRLMWICLLIPVRLFAWNSSPPAGQMSAKLPVCYFFLLRSVNPFAFQIIRTKIIKK